LPRRTTEEVTKREDGRDVYGGKRELYRMEAHTNKRHAVQQQQESRHKTAETDKI